MPGAFAFLGGRRKKDTQLVGSQLWAVYPRVRGELIAPFQHQYSEK